MCTCRWYQVLPVGAIDRIVPLAPRYAAVQRSGGRALAGYWLYTIVQPLQEGLDLLSLTQGGT